MTNSTNDDLPKISNETLERLIKEFRDERMKGPWYQDCESALRELKERRSDQEGVNHG